MRAGPTSVTALAGALAIGLAVLTGCGPGGTDSDTVTPEVVPVNPELATLPDIQVIADISYGADPAQRLDACLPAEDESAVQGAADADQPAGPELDDPAAPARAAIVVVHGTDTMAETAQVVGRAGLAKTVVFTGAMIPYSIQGSDALFNLGFAVALAQVMEPGTYVAMNARVFAWDAVRKDKASGEFVAKP